MTEALTYGSLQYFTEHEVIVLKTPDGKLVALRPPEAAQGTVIIVDEAPAFGEIYVRANATETAIAVQNTWYQITIFNANGESYQTEPNHSNDHITILRAGMYLVMVSASLESPGGTGAATFHVELKTNDSSNEFAGIHAHRDMAGGAGETGSISLSGLAEFAVDDTVELWLKNDTGTEDILVADVTLSVVQVGWV